MAKRGKAQASGNRRSETATGWAVYMVRCSDGSLYTGCTNDLEARVARHNAGKGASYTRSRRPVTLVFQERAEDRSAALKREAALKKLTRAEKLRLVAAGKGRKRRASTGSA